MDASATFKQQRTSFAKTALVLQGGGALGAYQAGVYEALIETGYEPDWVAGISNGGINVAIIAENKPADRLPRLKAFWELMTSLVPHPLPQIGELGHQIFNSGSAAATAMFGIPGFF